MKKLLYTTAILFLFASCKNIEKMVEKGQYDQAIEYAAHKLAGKKNKKTKHVKALEKAYAKLMSRDLQKLKGLESGQGHNNWDEILKMTDIIESRQEQITPLIPLISENGYEARFSLINVEPIRNRALDGAADLRYRIASEKLNNAIKEGNKQLARTAYARFSDVLKYREDYLDTRTLKRKAYSMGQVNILVKTQNNINGYLPQYMAENFNNLNKNIHKSHWKTFYYSEEEMDHFDYIAILRFDDLDVSPERKEIKSHTDKKKVKTGWEYVRGKEGKIKRDTCGTKLKRDVYGFVYADIIEILKTKSAFVAGELVYIDGLKNKVIKTQPLSVDTNFEDYALRFQGDRRALCNHDINRVKDFTIQFPTDDEMIFDATDVIKSKFVKKVKDMRI